MRSSHLFVPMPDIIREDMALLDRIHYCIPGWEVPKMRVEFFTGHYGFVVDYLAEALRELRKYNCTEIADCCFSFGSHLNARDVKAVRKTVSGLVKLIYPDGRVEKDQLAELLEFALEGRRRVKEQLKKPGSFEYRQTSFSYFDNQTREERFTGVPEEGKRELISIDPLAPGSVYTASVDDDGKVGLYRLEVGVSAGADKLKIAGGIDKSMKESILGAFAFIQGHKVQMGIAQNFATSDFHVEAIDLLGNRVSSDSGIALVAAIYSALAKSPPSLPADPGRPEHPGKHQTGILPRRTPPGRHGKRRPQSPHSHRKQTPLSRSPAGYHGKGRSHLLRRPGHRRYQGVGDQIDGSPPVKGQRAFNRDSGK